MNSSIYKALAIIFLLVGGISFSGRSAGDYGIAHGGTLVIEKGQVPYTIKKLNPVNVYLLYYGIAISSKYQGVFLKGDTITNYKAFTDSLKQVVTGFRLIYESKAKIDSVWQLNTAFEITDKAYNSGGNLLRILAYDNKGNAADEFVYDYTQKSSVSKTDNPSHALAVLLREYEVYNSYDRNKYSVNAVWALSIGIKKYEGIGGEIGINNCETDAISYNEFFKKQFGKMKSSIAAGTAYHEYLLLGKNATKEAIINALKDIAAKASSNDYFIFDFSGFSYFLPLDSVNSATCFFPYNETGYAKEMTQISKNHIEASATTSEKLISLNTLQEYIQQIPAVNQLFISEAGPSEKFKTEFIRTLIQKSPAVASLLNKNRVIIVPDKIGFDNISCNGETKQKGPINYFITALDSTYNIYDIFKEDGSADRITYKIKDGQYACESFSYNYFNIFFEKQFLQQYKEIFGDDEQTRGMKVKSKDVQETLNSLTGKHYALVVGTDNYKGTGWKKLTNPVKDARAVADELSNSYGFEVQLLEDKPMDSIYKAIREYYRIAKPNDQLVVYFAGHGDVDDELLSDGFIVCSDSKSVDDDPVRNSYIAYTKLQKMLNNIPARQVLVLLDVCHGGTFDVKAFDKNKREGTQGAASNKNVAAFLKDKLPLRTRKFLSSVGSEPAFDGQAGRHSPFANLLLQVLRAKGNGSNGIVTLSDINAVLQTASLNETATLRISPHMADFGNIDAFSEFILIPVEKATVKE